MTDDELIELYKPMVNFISEVLGPNSEVILHDLRDLDRSIVSISDDNLTGRQVGGTITDFGLKILHQKIYEGKNYIANYPGKLEGKNAELKASTYFIKNKHDNPIALLCINIDISELNYAKHVIEKFIGVANITPQAAVQESYNKATMNDMLNQLIEDTLKQYNKPVQLLQMDDKKQIVKELNDKGVFLIKGAVLTVASYLDTSEQTVYRYLK